jgi:hypothetical protein
MILMVTTWNNDYSIICIFSTLKYCEQENYECMINEDFDVNYEKNPYVLVK